MLAFYKKLSLKRKLTLLIALTSSVILLLTFFAFIIFENFNMRRILAEEISVLSNDISVGSAAAIIFDDDEAAQVNLDRLQIKTYILEAILVDAKGAKRAYYSPTENSASQQETTPPAKTGRLFFAPNRLESYEPIYFEGDFVGGLYITSGLDHIKNTLYYYIAIGIAGFLFYSFVAFILAQYLQGLISQPIISLVLSMDQVAKTKDYSKRLESDREDEVGLLFDGFNGMLEEIEQREQGLQQNQDRLDFMAHHDALTGLANRLLLTARMEQSIERSKRTRSRMAVLFLDLDRFKNINDTFGHDYGDQVLCEVARRLKNLLRDADTIARIGGDELIIVIEQVKRNDELARFVQKMLLEISAPITISESTFHITATIGISIFPDNGDNAKDLLTNADLAMYRGKESGRCNYVIYSPEMDSGQHEKVLLENQLRQALEDEHFVLHYQPQFDMISGELIGFEALLRWQDPVKGMIPPDHFIPLAEESGLIVPIGEWVVSTACEALKEIRKKWPLPLRMAVNISARQFRDDALISHIAKALYLSQIDPNLLEIELTESMVMNNVLDAINKMKQLKQTGVHLAIDDFGTGYSSLAYLKQFPMSRLKIDRSFVSEVDRNSSDQAIVKSIIALGKTFNFELIAEGIETTEQFDFLRDAGCDQAQGYLLSRPLPWDKLLVLLDSIYVDRPDLLMRKEFMPGNNLLEHPQEATTAR